MNVVLKKGMAVFLSICTVLMLIPVPVVAQNAAGLTVELLIPGYEFGTADSTAENIVDSIKDGETLIRTEGFTYKVDFKPRGSNHFEDFGNEKKKMIHAGEYRIVVTGNEGAYAGRSGEAVFIISPKTVDATLNTAAVFTREYDGTNRVVTPNGKIELSVEPVGVNFSSAKEVSLLNVNIVNPTYSSVNVGDNIVVTGEIEYTTTLDEIGKNYQDFIVNLPEILGSITPKIIQDGAAIDTTGLSVTKPYDAGTGPDGAVLNGKAYVVNTNQSVEVLGTVVSLADSAVGQTTATVRFDRLSGEGARNYTLGASVEADGVAATITKAEMSYPHTRREFSMTEGERLDHSDSELHRYFTMNDAKGIPSEPEVKVVPTYFKDPQARQSLSLDDQKAFAPGIIQSVYVKLTPEASFANRYNELILPYPIRITVNALPQQDLEWDHQSALQNGEYTAVYGDQLDLSASNKTPGGGNISYKSSRPDVATVDAATGRVNVKGVGSATITATAERVDGTFGKTHISYTLHAVKKPVKIKIRNITGIVYTQNIPQLSYYVLNENDNAETTDSDTGLVIGDNKDALTVNLTTDAVKGSSPGEYTVNGTFLGSAKYEVTSMISGKLIIDKADSSAMVLDLKPIKILKNKVRDIVFDVRPFFGVYELSELALNGNPTDDRHIIDGAVTIDGNSIRFRTNSVESGTATIPLTASFRDYTDRQFSVVIEVADKKTPNITGITVKSKEYDGKPATYTGRVTVDGKTVNNPDIKWYKSPTVGNDPLSIPAPVKPGTYILKVNIPHSDVHVSDQYDAGTLELKFSVFPKKLIVKPNDVSIVSGSQLPDFSLNFIGVVGNEKLDLTGSHGGFFSPKFEICTLDGRAANQNPLKAGVYRIVFTNPSNLISYLRQNSVLGDNENYGQDNFTVREGVLTVAPASDINHSQDSDRSGDQEAGGSNVSSNNVEKTAVIEDSGKKTVVVSAGATKKGTVVNATVSDMGIENAVVIAEKLADKNQLSTLEIKVDVEKNTEDVKLMLSEKSIEILAQSKLEAVTLDSPVGRVSMDRKALDSILRQSSGRGVEVSVAKADMRLNDKQKEVVGKSPVYDITVKSDGKEIKTFEQGCIVIALPYELKAEELPNRVVIQYVKETGNLQEVKSHYDLRTKHITFVTDHLSKYVISYKPWVNPYRDVEEGNWYYHAVKFVAERGFIIGTGEETFSPGVLTTRAVLASILHRMEDMPNAEANPFVDVEDGMFYTEAVKWAAEKNIVSGYHADTFSPNDYLTREQVALMMRNYARYKGVNTMKVSDLSVFEDKGFVSPWAMSAVEWAYAEGIVSGKPDMILDPKGYATRAEIAMILTKLIETLNR